MLNSINIQSSVFQNIIIVGFIGGPVNIGERFCISSESEEQSRALTMGLECQRINFFFIWRKESWFKSNKRDYKNVE